MFKGSFGRQKIRVLRKVVQTFVRFRKILVFQSNIELLSLGLLFFDFFLDERVVSLKTPSLFHGFLRLAL